MFPLCIRVSWCIRVSVLSVMRVYKGLLVRGKREDIAIRERWLFSRIEKYISYAKGRGRREISLLERDVRSRLSYIYMYIYIYIHIYVYIYICI